MAAITGGDLKAGFGGQDASPTFGTAELLAAGDGFCFNSLVHSTNPTELSAAPLGCGFQMLKEATQGALSPAQTVETNPTYQDAMIAAIATFFGTAAAPVEQTATEGDYLHQFLYNATLAFGTLAFESSTTTVIEWPSAYASTLRIAASEIPNYLALGVDFVSGDRELSSATNTNGTMASVTISDDEQIIVNHDSDFQINLQSGGALSGSDQLDIVSYELTLSRPKRYVREITGSLGLSAPVADGLMEGELTVVLNELADHTYFTASEADTVYKALFEIEGTQIGAGLNKTFRVNLPGMQLVQDPNYDISDAGLNPHTLTFKLLEADTAPTGLTDTKPYIDVINERSTAYIA